MKRIEELITEDLCSVRIVGHTRPDGDCIGSVLGLANYLRESYPGLSVIPYLEKIAPKFLFLTGAEEACAAAAEVDAEGAQIPETDLLFVLDCGDEGRIGGGRALINSAAKIVCIDHHISNKGFADVNIIEPEKSSASELLCRFLDPEKISLKTAECLYTGIVHDTGVFKHSNTTRATMETAGMLLEKGVSSTRVINDTFYTKTYVQNRILGYALLKSDLWEEERTVVSSLTAEEQSRYGAGPQDVDGIIDQLKLTAGCECAILVYETARGDFKVSMRSDGAVNVSAIAQNFGGGGHVCAAGCSFSEQPNQILAKLRAQIHAQLNA